MRLANFNIRATPPMPDEHVRSDVAAAWRTQAKLINWQELGKHRRYRRILEEVLPGRRGWVHLHTDTNTIQSVDTDHLEIVRVRSHRLTKGNPLIPQPARHTNEVVVRDLATGLLCAVLASHFTNGGYNGRRRPTRRWRQRLWDRQFEATRELVHQLHAEGLDVVGSGDYNNEEMEKFHPHQRWIANRGIMKMWLLPAAGERLETREEKRIQHLHTDHPGLAATIRRGL